MFREQDWAKLSPLLDRALELDRPSRSGWLVELAREEPDLATTLGELLAEKDAADARHFLETSPARWLGEAPAAGQRLGAWRLERPLGRGGMGAVWLARRCDGRYEGEAAIKLLNLSLVGGPAEQRFVREGTLLAALRHLHIAQLVDAGVTDAGHPYLVLEHVEGSPVDEHCRVNRLGLRTRLRVFLDVLDAVGYAHRHLVVHRDLKPGNILVTADGTVKLLDFGIATLLTPAVEPEGRPELTREIGAALTPEYAAPEQFLGEAVTTATDIYALGRILYALLAGRPVAGETPLSAAEAARLALAGEPPLMSEACSERTTRRLLRGDLDNIVRKALARDPGERYATAEAFAQDLRRHLDDEPVSARPDSLGYRVGKFVRRHRGGVLSGAVAALALVGVTIFAVLQMLEAERQRDEAEAQRQRAQGYNTAITSLLSQVGPGGRALAPEELLERAVRHVEGTYGDDPAFLVQMLIMISGRYYDLQDTNREYDTLVRAERAARRSSDAYLLFRVHCNTVETELEAGRKEAAQRRLAEARRLMDGIASVPAGDHAACLRGDAQLAGADGDMRTAISRLQEALRVLERAGGTEGNDYAGMLSMLAVYTGDWGDLLEAHGHLAALVELDRRLGRADSRPGQIGRIAFANSFLYLGDVREAVARYREVLDGGTGEGPEKMFLGRALARLGEHEAALSLLRESVAELDDSGHERFRIRSRLALAEGLLAAGRSDEAAAQLDGAVDLIAHDPSRHRFLGLDADRLRALALLASGRVEAARERVEDALEGDAVLRHPGPERARLLLIEARAWLAGDRPADAARAAGAAASLFERHSLDPLRNADLGEALLVAAEAQLGLGDAAAASRNLARAATALANGLGAGHILTRKAESLAAAHPAP